MGVKILEQVPLAPLTTLRIGGPARYFCEVAGESELRQALGFAGEKSLPIFLLAGGSNVLFADRGFDGLVIRPMFKGLEVSPPLPSPYPKGRAGEEILIRVGAGEALDEVIAWTVANGWWGMENLSFIPGAIGGAIYMNAGAYGQEIGDCVMGVEVFDTVNRKWQMLNREECQFGYRRSIFNEPGAKFKLRYIVVKVILRLNKRPAPVLSYPDVQKYFWVGGEIQQSEIRNAIIDIRKSKGQDVSKIWSAGSFFKNWLIPAAEVERITGKASRWGDKLPAGYVLDKMLGLKGLQAGGAKLSELQVINIVNTGGASAADVLELFKKVRAIVRQKTGLTIESEPELVGFAPEDLAD